MERQQRNGAGVSLAFAVILVALFTGVLWTMVNSKQLGQQEAQANSLAELSRKSAGLATPEAPLEKATIVLVRLGNNHWFTLNLGLEEAHEVAAKVPGSAIAPVKPIKLFNGKDLTNFYTYLGSPGKGAKPYGKNNDPEKVFAVQDGMIRISGKVFGGLITEQQYANYHLVAEFKWGEKTWPPREKAARDSGILLHCVGADGAAGGVWMEAIECQMIEGGTGDFILVAGKGPPSLTAKAEKRRGQFYYNPDAQPVDFTIGRINWYGRDPDWKDVKGFRGPRDVEKPVGQWNRLECLCNEDRITITLNGTIVNQGTKASHRQGKILIQSEGAEVFFRRIDLLPLPE
jgi:hypothetical protein